MQKKKNIVAMMYDFDKTLCTKDMQEFEFIKSLGMTEDEYWDEVNEFARKEGMERILSSLYMMIRKSKEKEKLFNRESLEKLGKSIRFFKGVKEYFQRINKFGEEYGLIIEHYIISSGLSEIIQGSEISDCFKKIYACEFHYNEDGIPDWPKQVVNYTTKTQFLFRINKGVLDVYDDIGLNKYKEAEERRISFRNMIYIGDGLTDIPCMQLVKTNGGQSIAVYQSQKKAQVTELLSDGRVDFIVKADYSEGSELDKIIKVIIEKMSVESRLKEVHQKHIKSVKMKIAMKVD